MHMGRIVTVFQMGIISINSVQTILNTPVPKVDLQVMDDKKKTALKRSSLVVKNLTYTYPESSPPQIERSCSDVEGEFSSNPDSAVLKGLNFSIAAGEKVGVLGGIGSGKSTLVNFLNHHLDVKSGQIFWGGEDITTISRRDWRSYVRTITQDPYLFSDTIAENVKFGAKNNHQTISQKDIEDVLELSQLSDDVFRFETGDQTLVGEKGIMLSGGQKQRLSIARALLTPSDLIIMDNVLSAVDYETERKILKGVFNRIKEHSLLVVSHRISALQYMDNILVLDQGEIIARGTHAELLLSCSYYQETWELQQHEMEAKV
jgi:ATP-binding cassette subfamily B protein